jgi:hypothetical protein
MTNPDTRPVRAAICVDGLVDAVELDGDPGVSACHGCAGCAPLRYRAPAPVGADRAWIAAQAARIRTARAVAPIVFRAG